jgi:UDP-glucose 4-epimerase
MKCLVTGGAGFIGSHIQDRLIELGHEVAIVDNLRSGRKENLNPKSTFFEVDVTDKEKLLDTFALFKPETVFHLAAQNEVPYSMDHPYEDQKMNIVGMMNLLDACNSVGVKKVVYSNTGGAYYGDVAESDLPVKEDHIVLAPTSYYGVSKLAAEFYLRLMGRLYNIPWVSLRYANVYGPRQAGNREAGVVAIFTQKMLQGETPTINGQGQHTRDYIFVLDVAEANIKALDFDKNEAFNVSTGRRISNNEVFTAIKDALGVEMEPNYGPDRPGDTLHNALSPEKAKNLLGWEPKVLFKDGVKQTVEFYKNSNA